MASPELALWVSCTTRKVHSRSTGWPGPRSIALKDAVFALSLGSDSYLVKGAGVGGGGGRSAEWNSFNSPVFVSKQADFKEFNSYEVRNDGKSVCLLYLVCGSTQVPPPKHELSMY